MPQKNRFHKKPNSCNKLAMVQPLVYNGVTRASCAQDCLGNEYPEGTVFRERIKQAYETLTPSFKRLAEFILSRELDVAFMTATELAHSLDVDAATVVRFSQALGYSGYRELSHEVQRVVKGDLTAAYAGFPDAETSVDQLKALLENERHNLEVAVAQVTGKAAEILELLGKAERVWVVGEATSLCLAKMFVDRLRLAGIAATAVDADPAEAAQIAWDLGAKDFVLGLGTAGTGLDTATLLRYALEKRAKVAAVAVSAVSPPAQVADRALICPSSTPIGLPSSASLMVMLEVLWQALLASDKRSTKRQVGKLQETYTSLLQARAEQAARIDAQQLWQEF